MQIFVNDLFDDKKTLEVPPTDTMLDIIIKCLDESPRNKGKFLRNNKNNKVQMVLGTGKPLEEGRTLAYYNIQEGTTLHMIPKLRNKGTL